MDKIEDFQKKNDTNVVIKTAANSAMEKLKKYYKITDALVYTVSTSIYIFYLIFFFFTIYVGLFIFNNIFTIFLVLDPRLKLTYHRAIIGKKNILQRHKKQFPIYMKTNMHQ